MGAAPGAVDDPTPAFPGGQTAADLASNRGHKGIAGYLAEAYLTSQLSSLNINENEITAIIGAKISKEIDAKVFTSDLGVDDNSLKGSLAAVRKSSLAAALIQDAFRNLSFRHRQLTKSHNDSPDNSLDLVALGSLNRGQKFSHFEDYLHSAAKRIQKNYRGWKGRKEFLDIRSRIVKIQVLSVLLFFLLLLWCQYIIYCLLRIQFITFSVATYCYSCLVSSIFSCDNMYK